MNVLVLIKQVPDTGIGLRVLDSQLDEVGLKWVLSPYDEFALEEALKLKTSLQGKVYVLSLGPSRAKESLLSALALGADEAHHLKSNQDLKDPFVVASCLASYLKKIDPLSLILCGKMAADSNDFAVPQMIAQLLSWSFVTNVNALEYKDSSFKITRECGSGVEEVLKAKCPLVLSVDKGLNQPRYPSLPGIMKAKKKPFYESEATNLKENIKLLSLSLPPQKKDPVLFKGTAKEQVDQLIHSLKTKEKIL